MDESLLLEGSDFNDDRSDFKTKNQTFAAETRLQQNLWVSYVSRTSPNTGDVVYHHLGSEEEKGKQTHRMAETVGAGKTMRRRECIHGMEDLMGETDMSSVVKQQFGLRGKKCLNVRVRHKEMSDPDVYEAFFASGILRRYVEANMEIPSLGS